MTLSPSPAPFTPHDGEVSLVDPFEALRAYALRGPLRSMHPEILPGGDPMIHTDTIRPVADPKTKPSVGECDVAPHALATGCLGTDFVQKLTSSDSPRVSCDVRDISTSSSSLNDGRDAELLRFESSRTNSMRHSSENKHPRGHAREFHLQLAATNLGRERRTVRVPAHVDAEYIRFREELKLKLTSKGDECIWRGLVVQDDPRR